MAYESSEARWYLAEIVTEVRVAGESENVVHNNLILIRANSPEEAYQKALTRGHDMEETYESPEGQKINVFYRGLSDLNVIQDELEDGAEIAYEEMLDLTESDIQEMLTEKEQLGIFRPDDGEFDEHDHSHDHDSQSVLDEAMRIINNKKNKD